MSEDNHTDQSKSKDEGEGEAHDSNNKDSRNTKPSEGSSRTVNSAGGSTDTRPGSRRDTHSYRGWLNSDNFFKRAFAVLGYGLVAQLMITAVFVLASSILFAIIAIVAAS